MATQRDAPASAEKLAHEYRGVDAPLKDKSARVVASAPVHRYMAFRIRQRLPGLTPLGVRGARQERDVRLLSNSSVNLPSRDGRAAELSPGLDR